MIGAIPGTHRIDVPDCRRVLVLQTYDDESAGEYSVTSFGGAAWRRVGSFGHARIYGNALVMSWTETSDHRSVVPAQAGTQRLSSYDALVPAFAGTTEVLRMRSFTSVMTQ